MATMGGQSGTKARQLNWRQRLLVMLLAPLLRLVARLLFATYRLHEVEGKDHLRTLVQNKQAMLLCCWHQRLPCTVGWLLAARRYGLRPGFLVSPSRDGEYVAAFMGGLGVHILRGSANRTGARAFRDMYTTLKDGISPIMAVDGPHGPAGQVKTGTIMLAQMTRTPLLPISFTADRYWQLGSWDRMLIPRPFARVSVRIAEPLWAEQNAAQQSVARQLGQALNELS